MKVGAKYRLPLRRRLKGKTDYRKRLALLKSKKPRLVVRKSLKHTIAQVVEFDPKGDRVVASASTVELKKLGWNYSTRNIPSAYLVGLLVGKRASKKKIKGVVFDAGLYSNIKGSRINSVLKGALDAGLEIPHSADILPTEDRTKGKHIFDYAQKLKSEDKRKYDMRFSISKPEGLMEAFEKVKSAIMKGG